VTFCVISLYLVSLKTVSSLKSY